MKNTVDENIDKITVIGISLLFVLFFLKKKKKIQVA